MSVCYPLKKIVLLTKTRCYTATALISVGLLIPYATGWLLMRTSIGTVGTRCGTFSNYASFWKNPWIPIMMPMLYLFIPFLAIIALNIHIVMALFAARRHRRSLMRKGSTGNQIEAERHLVQKQEKAENMITLMLVVTSGAFLLLTLPQCIFFMSSFQKDITEQGITLSKAQKNLFKEISYMLADSTHALNFLFYFFTVKRFRDFALGLGVKVLVKLRLRKAPVVEDRYFMSHSTKTTTIHHVNHDTTKMSLMEDHHAEGHH